ncbi:MAG TPA: hypothetical protein PKI99_09395 [Terrimesophilobacter sp.]|nr:hypothetical protein [Terrimesophilobacter sp.]
MGRVMLSRELGSMADTLRAHADTGTPVGPHDAKTLALTLHALALLAEGLEAVAAAQEVHDAVSRILSEPTEEEHPR